MGGMTGATNSPGDAVRVAPIDESSYEDVLPYIAAYQRFYLAEPDEDRNRAFFRRFLHPGDDGLLLGAWLGQRLVGFTCLYWTFSSVSAREIVLLSDLYVDEAIRGGGIGLALIEEAIRVARSRGAGHIEWLTAVDNRRAQRLYERLPADRYSWFGYEVPLD
jgi:GNAT superfamily N-acetyltransferase